MAEGLDEIVQKILLEGDVEVINQLGEIGETGVEAFKELYEAIEGGASKLEAFATGAGLVAAALVGIAGAVAAFAEGQAEAIQQTNLLAKAFGATTDQITGIEAAFAAAGVSTTTFETFAQRLTTTIAREWPAIAESIRTASTEQSAAQERVVASTLRVQDAQRNLGNVNTETSNKMANANLRVEQTFITLQFSAQKALQTIQHDSQAVEGAQLSLAAAQQRLNTLRGQPPSESEKKNLEIAQAQFDVDKARQSISDARLKQQQDRAEAAAKQKAEEQAAADAQEKRELVAQEAVNARAKAELQLKEAVTQREQAEERASQQALKSVPAITTLVNNIISGQKAASQQIDITQVKIQDLGKGIIAAASAGGKEPTGLQVMVKLSELLSSEQGKLLDSSQRLAIVQQLGQQRMAQTGASASELLNVLSRGPAVFNKYEETAKKAFATSDEAAHNVEHFRDAFEQLAFSIQLVNRSIAAAALPILTQALHAINESLDRSDGLLHLFVEGIKGIGSAIGLIISGFQQVADAIDHALNLEHGRTFQVLIAGLVILVGAFATAWLAIPAIIAAVVVAIGLVAENWDKVKKAAADAWKAFQDTTVYKFLDGVIDRVKQILDWLKQLPSWFGKGDGKTSGDANKADNPAAGTKDGLTNPQAYATGGEVHGPGSGTSDSINARLSDGEFVQKADAVSFWGTDFMHAINNMTFPGFAEGGQFGGASPGARPGSGMANTPATSVLNLSIDGNQFGGLRGPKNVVDSLATYAVGRQTTSAGKQPSWVS